jgi:hypothetical protein
MSDLVIPDFLKRQGWPDGRALTVVPEVKVSSENLDPEGRPADQLVAEAQQPWLRLKNAGRQTWKDWYAIGLALTAGRGQIMHVLCINKPQGGPYRRAIQQWLQKHHLDDINKTTRSLLLDLIDDEQSVADMMAEWSEAEQAERNSPSAVHRHWKQWQRQRDGGGQQKKPHVRNELRQQIKDQAAQIEQLTAHVAELEAARETVPETETETETTETTETEDSGITFDAAVAQIALACGNAAKVAIPTMKASKMKAAFGVVSVGIGDLEELLRRLQFKEEERND